MDQRRHGNESARILLIEDNPHDIQLTLDAFEQVNLSNKIHVIETGTEALDYLFGKGDYADRKAYPLPDLILLDLKLPGIDGHEILKQMKQRPVLKRIPVVVLSSSQDEGDRILSYDSGANSYLVKPVSFSEFMTVAHKIGEYWLTLNVRAPLKTDPPHE